MRSSPKCNSAFARAGRRVSVRLVHGYGSSGEGGVLRARLRGFCDTHADRIAYARGEDAENNPGVTLVTVRATAARRPRPARGGDRALLHRQAAREGADRTAVPASGRTGGGGRLAGTAAKRARAEGCRRAWRLPSELKDR